VRVVFVADVDEENQVRALIEGALANGECVGPDGNLSRWEATAHLPGVLSEREGALGAKIAASSGAR
jgi:hypothetical protein